jgi:uncharacterized phage protein (TIGR01671 family)
MEFKFRFWGILDGEETPKMICGDDFAFYDYAPINDQFKSLKDIVVMQYAGIQDKKGKEVYDGDIYRNGENGLIGVLEYHPGIGGYTLYTTEKKDGEIYNHRPFADLDLTDFEVIGNIHHNPDLL